MAAGHSRAIGYGVADRGALLAADLAHGPDGENEVQRLELFDVLKGFQCVRDLYGKTFVYQRALKDLGDLLWLVAQPAAPDDQCFFAHGLAPLP